MPTSGKGEAALPSFSSLPSSDLSFRAIHALKISLATFCFFLIAKSDMLSMYSSSTLSLCF